MNSSTSLLFGLLSYSLLQYTLYPSFYTRLDHSSSYTLSSLNSTPTMDRVSQWREGLSSSASSTAYRDQASTPKRPSVILDLTSDSSAGGSPSSVRIIDSPQARPDPKQREQGDKKQQKINSMFMPRPPQQQQQQPLKAVENNQPKPFASSASAFGVGSSSGAGGAGGGGGGQQNRLAGMARIPKQKHSQPRFSISSSASPADDSPPPPPPKFPSSASAFRTSTGSGSGSNIAQVGQQQLSVKDKIAQALRADTQAKGIPFAVPQNPPYQRPRPAGTFSLSPLPSRCLSHRRAHPPRSCPLPPLTSSLIQQSPNFDNKKQMTSKKTSWMQQLADSAI